MPHKDLPGRDNTDSSYPLALPGFLPYVQMTPGQRHAFRRFLGHLKNYSGWIRSDGAPRLDCAPGKAGTTSTSSIPHYHNVIAIEGGRGAGKTTLLTTILNLLRNKSGQNVFLSGVEEEDLRFLLEQIHQDTCYLVLDPIDPDLFNGDRAEIVLTWIFHELHELVMDELRAGGRPLVCNRPEHAVADLSEYEPSEYMERIIAARNELFETLAIVAGRYIDQAIRLSATRWDFSNEINNAQRSSWELQRIIRTYFDSVVWALRCLPRSQYARNHEVLIVIPIDDMDLAGHRAFDLVKMISNYLQHRNVLVIAMGERGTFLEAFREHLLREVPKTLVEATADSKCELACTLLEKAILPEASASIDDSAFSLYQSIVKPILGIAADSVSGTDDTKFPASLFQHGNVLGFDSESGTLTTGSVTDTGGFTALTNYIDIFGRNIRQVRSTALSLKQIVETTDSRSFAANLRPLLNLLVQDCHGTCRSEGSHTPYVTIDAVTGMIVLDISRLAGDLADAGDRRSSYHGTVLKTCFLHDLVRLHPATPVDRVYLVEMPRDDQFLTLAVNQRLPAQWLTVHDIPVHERLYVETDLVLYNADRILHLILHTLQRDYAVVARLRTDVMNSRAQDDPVARCLVKSAICLALIHAVKPLDGRRKGYKLASLVSAARRSMRGKVRDEIIKRHGVFLFGLVVDYTSADEFTNSGSYGIYGSTVRGVIEELGKLFRELTTPGEDEEVIAAWLQKRKFRLGDYELQDYRHAMACINRRYLIWNADERELELTQKGAQFLGAHCNR